MTSGKALHSGLIADLAVVTVVAAATGLLTKRLGQPSILGYLLAGLIVGPYIPIPLFADPQRMAELAEVGVVLVMFAVGLEFRVHRLVEILPTSGLTAGIQIAALSWAGFTVGSVMGWSTAASVCLGATLAISSTMVVSAVLRKQPVDPDVRAQVFGVLVVQDVVAIVLMAIVTALSSGESLGLRSLAMLIGQLTAVVIAILIAGLLILPRLVRFALSQADTEVLIVLIVGAAFGLAMAANLFGYSVALGAFLSGMAVAESGRSHEVEEAIEPLRALFSAIFFVSIGMTVDPRVAYESLPLALTLCVVVIGAQFFSVSIATLLTGGSLRRGIYSGIALGQIGELSFILATIAIAGGTLPKETLPALVTVATITAFSTSHLLSRAQTLVEFVDRRLPDRGHQALAAYQAFFRRASNPKEGPSFRRPVAAVLLDWAALVVLFVLQFKLVPLIEARYTIVAQVAGVLLAAPFVLGLVRSGSKIASGVRDLTTVQLGPTPRAKTVEAIALLAIVLGIGLPTMALMGPLFDGPWVEVVMLLAMLLVFVVLGLRLVEINPRTTSSVAQLTQDLADHLRAGAEDEALIQGEHDLGDQDLLAGLDYQTLALEPDSPAQGQSLAQLDLRCRSGATVVAIFREEQTILLPTGHEQLCAADRLAISGSEPALLRARAILMPETEPRTSPEPADPPR